MDDIEEAVAKLVADFTGARRVTSERRLYHDLGLAGDDVDELFEAIQQRFGTRFEGFSFYDYFPDEGEAVMDRLERFLHVAPSRKPLTIGHLAEVVRRGAWFDA